ncbi:MAG: PAS domain-containing protein [Longimicrobiales bacterium]
MNPGLRGLAAVVTDPLVILDDGGTIVLANPAARTLFGDSDGDPIGRALSDLMSDDPGRVDELLREAARSSGPMVGGLTPRNRAVPFVCTAAALRTSGDACPFVAIRLQPRAAETNRFRLLDDQVSRLTDEVARRRRAESRGRALAERLERYRQLLEQAQHMARVGSWEWTVATGELTWSREMYRLFGFDPDGPRITYEAFVDRLHPDDRSLMETTIQRAMETGDPYAVDHRIIRADGAERVLHGRGRVVFGTDGRPVALLGSGQDITDRKREEDALRLLAEAGRILGSSLDFEDTLAGVARLAVAHFADWAVIDLLEGTSVRRIAASAPDPAMSELVDELARRWPPRLGDSHGVALVLETGEPRLVREVPDGLLDEETQAPEHAAILRRLGVGSLLIAPMVARGRVVGAVWLGVSSRDDPCGALEVALAMELAGRAGIAVDNARLYEEARTAARSRDELVAAVSHDLRNPLGAILSGLALLREFEVPPDRQAEVLRAVGLAAKRMDRLATDLLDAARLEAGRLELQSQRQALAPLVEQSVAVLTLSAEEKGVVVEIHLPELPDVVVDGARVQQVLENLLVNAVRHTPAGGRVVVRAAEDPAGWIEVVVEDTGPGVPEGLRDTIFDRYRQGEGGHRGSAGLGLPIARGLVEAHGGRIRVGEGGEGGGTFRSPSPPPGIQPHRPDRPGGGSARSRGVRPRRTA